MMQASPNATPLVSVLVVTYNHERYIEQAIEGVLSQHVPFSYEIVVGDDCSTDRTSEILHELERRHPETIRLLPRAQNLGPRKNWLDAYTHCRGKYVAYLDGDDYWCSPEKLRKQVALLEAHPGLSMCFHAVEVIDEETRARSRPRPLPLKSAYTLEDLADSNFISKSSVMVRNGLLLPFPEVLYSARIGDWVYHALHALRGDIGFVDEVLSVYRMHSGGIHYATVKDLLADLRLANAVCADIAEFVGGSRRLAFDRGIRRRDLRIVRVLLERGQHEPAREMLREAWARRAANPELQGEIVRLSLRAWSRPLNDAWLAVRPVIAPGHDRARYAREQARSLIKMAMRRRGPTKS